MLLMLMPILGSLILLIAMAFYGVGPELALQFFTSDLTRLMLIVPWLFVALSIGLFLKSRFRGNKLAGGTRQANFPFSKVLITLGCAVFSTAAILSINSLLK